MAARACHAQPHVSCTDTDKLGSSLEAARAGLVGLAMVGKFGPAQSHGSFTDDDSSAATAQQAEGPQEGEGRGCQGLPCTA